MDIPIEANITGAPAATLQNFITDSSAGSAGGPLTVTGHFEWDGSSLGATINIPRAPPVAPDAARGQAGKPAPPPRPHTIAA